MSYRGGEGNDGSGAGERLPTSRRAGLGIRTASRERPSTRDEPDKMKYSVEEKRLLTLGADRPIGRKDGQRGNRVNTQTTDGKPERYGRVDRGGKGREGRRRYGQCTYDADDADRGIGGIRANRSVGSGFPHVQRIPGPGGSPQG